MANLTYELGFDGNANAIEGVRGGIYPLQVYLVADEEHKVISACNPDQIRRSDQLNFRIYDFSDPAAKRPHGMTPVTLQILFTRATKSDDSEVKPPFSPIVENGLPLAQLATTTFTPLPEPTGSIAFGKAALAGWGGGIPQRRSAPSTHRPLRFPRAPDGGYPRGSGAVFPRRPRNGDRRRRWRAMRRVIDCHQAGGGRQDPNAGQKVQDRLPPPQMESRLERLGQGRESGRAFATDLLGYGDAVVRVGLKAATPRHLPEVGCSLAAVPPLGVVKGEAAAQEGTLRVFFQLLTQERNGLRITRPGGILPARHLSLGIGEIGPVQVKIAAALLERLLEGRRRRRIKALGEKYGSQI